MLGTKYHSPGEDIDHRVNPVLLVAIRKRHHFDSVGEERPVKKSVEEKHLTLGWKRLKFRIMFFGSSKKRIKIPEQSIRLWAERRPTSVRGAPKYQFCSFFNIDLPPSF